MTEQNFPELPEPVAFTAPDQLEKVALGDIGFIARRDMVEPVPNVKLFTEDQVCAVIDQDTSCRSHECKRVRAEMQAEIERLRGIAKAVEDAPEVIVFDNEGVTEIQGSGPADDEMIERIKDTRVKLVEMPDAN